MDDRQLLDAAARAAGIEIHWRPNGGPVATIGGVQDWWNPLTDDGDALRLARAMMMRVHFDGYGTAARIGDQGTWHGCEAHRYGGIERATRLAIVRCAAAEIGKALAGETEGR